MIDARLSALGYRRLLRPVMFRLQHGDPELVHEQTLRQIAAVAHRPLLRQALGLAVGGDRKPIQVAGVDFAGRVGLAAGMDKNGIAVEAWSALGFGFAELGTVTARSQPGNEKPRLFRLPGSDALINRMGFNNHGAAALAAGMARIGIRRGNGAAGMAIGVSIGKTKSTPLAEATQDYLISLRLLTPYADYVAVNVSSPNTPGLRSLQNASALRELITALVAEAGPVPIMVKLAPDLSDDALAEAVGVCEDAGAAGLIATNTTLDRTGVAAADAERAATAGGLSGAPLTVRAREVVSFLARQSRLPVIGVGGILTADDGRALIDAGASLLQVYTGFVYRGPALVQELNALG